MTPAEIAQVLQGLRLHGEGAGAYVARARADDAGKRLILDIDDDGVQQEWDVTVARLTEVAGGSPDATRLSAALIILYTQHKAAKSAERAAAETGGTTRTAAETGGTGASHGQDAHFGSGDHSPDKPSGHTRGHARDTGFRSEPDTVYEGAEASEDYPSGGSVSPGPGDPDIDL